MFDATTRPWWVPGVSADAQGAVGTLARTRFGGLALGIGAAG
jgi:hypothetical protein